jgi:hypothetical protein
VLIALLRVTDLGVDARRALTATQIAIVASWRRRREDLAAAVAREEAIRLAQRVNALDEQLKTNAKRITELRAQSRARAAP